MAVLGRQAFSKRLRRKIPDRIRKVAAEVLEENARELVAEMRRLAPVDTGELKESIGWTWGEAPAGSFVIGTVGGSRYDTLRITIYAGGGEAFYARFQEFGTVNMAPTPFFFPSYRKLKRKLKGRATRKINKAIREL